MLLAPLTAFDWKFELPRYRFYQLIIDITGPVMSDYRTALSLLRMQDRSQSSAILLKLIAENPTFAEYYVSLVFARTVLDSATLSLAANHLERHQYLRLLQLSADLQRVMVYGRSETQQQTSQATISFCIPVKNRSRVRVSWNGITRGKTYLSSYVKSPRNFDLALLKNCIRSIVESQIPGIGFEIIIVDFGSDDDPPKNWMGSLVPEGIAWKIVNESNEFSRGKGLNTAARESIGDILFFLDADMLVSRALIAQSLHIVHGQKKAFFPICFSYSTPFHKEGWSRTEGWGNLVLSRAHFRGKSWWEKKSWGSEDDHMRDQLEGEYVRVEGDGFFHQWHPEGEFKTKHYAAQKNKLNVVIGVTTYNRVAYLQKFVESWNATRNKYYNWTLIISDDGSEDGTLSYLDNLNIPDCNLIVLRHKRTGVHESTNSILEKCVLMDFDYGFKCDDDVIFLKPGWDDLYIDGMGEYPYLCNYDVRWRKAKPIAESDRFVAYGSAYYSQGAFWTFTKGVLGKLGWFDTKTFGFKGYGHIDYSVRACRAGFNKIDTLFDVKNSNSFVTLQLDGYVPAISLDTAKKEFGLVVDEGRKERMRKLIMEERRSLIYVGRSSIFDFPECTRRPTVHLIIHNNHIGGAEYVHFCHASALRQAGCSVNVWSAGTGYFFEYFKGEGFNISYVPDLFVDGSDSQERLIQAISDGDYIYNCNAYNDELFLRIGKLRSIYYHTIVHSDVDWIVKHQSKYRFSTYKFIAIHERIRDALSSAGIAKEKIHVVKNGLVPSFRFGYEPLVDETVRAELNISDSSTVIGFVGRIARDKNALDLLDVYEAVLSTRNDVICLIVGGGSTRTDDQGYLEEFTRKLRSIRGADRILNLGERSGREIERLLNAIDVAVNVSPSEGLPISMLEQLAKGVFCVYPGFGGIQDVLSKCPSRMINIAQRKNGKDLRYSSMEKQGFVQALASLRREELLPHRGSICSYARKTFSMDITYPQIVSAFFGRQLELENKSCAA